MKFDSGFEVFKQKGMNSIISSGDKVLDGLLGGKGLHEDLVYVFYGDKDRTTSILLSIAVNVQKSREQGGLGDAFKVAFVDGNNKFNPYVVSKLAVLQNLSPRAVLENILVARAFTWDQMIELLENRLSRLQHVKTVLISGITSLFPNHEKATFEDLLRAIAGIKAMLRKTRPLIAITAPLNEFSSFRPKGGKILSHFGNVLVLVNDTERYVEYILVQHPYLPERRVLRWKPRIPKRNLARPSRNATLDCWL